MPVLAAVMLFALARPVTLHERAQPLSALAKTLSAAYGFPVAIQPALAREWLLVDVTEADPEALLTKIAEVTHAQWEADGKGMRLHRPAERDRQLAADERAFHAANLRAQWKTELGTPYRVEDEIDRIRKAAAEAPEEWGRTTRRGRPRGSQSPTNRYTNELLDLISAEAITRLRHGQGFVLSSQPRGVQRPFPPSCRPVLAKLLRDQEKYVAALPPIDPANARDAVPVRVTLHVFAARPHPGVLAISSRLRLYDERGTEVSSGNQTWMSPDRRKYRVPSQTPGMYASPAPMPEVEDFLAGNVATDKVPPAVWPVLSSPESDGRMPRVWGDVALNVAKREGKLLVANLPDFLEEASTPGVGEKRPIAQMEAWINTLEVRREGPWMTMRPRFPGMVGTFRGDRGVWASTIKAVAAGRSIPIEEAAIVDFRLRPTFNISYERINRFDRAAGAATVSFESDKLALDVIRLLPAGFRQMLYDGRPLAFPSLSPVLQDRLRLEFLDTGDSFDVFAENQVDRRGGDAGPQGTGITEVVDAAQVAGMTLRAEVETTPAFVARPSSASFQDQLMTAEEFAATLDENLKPKPQAGEGEEVFYERARLVFRRSIRMVFRLPSGFARTEELVDYAFDPRDPYLTPGQMPARVKELLRRLPRDRDTSDGGR